MTNNSENYVIEKFDGSDFALWINDITKGVIPKPKDGTELKAWTNKDVQAQRIISQSVDKTVLIHLLECEDSAAMINHLESIYEIKSDTSLTLSLPCMTPRAVV